MNANAISRDEQNQLDSALFKKLEELASKIPSDPNLYREDVEKYSKMYQEEFQKLLTDIQRKNQKFAELLIFLSRCVKYFSKNLAYVPQQVIDLLKNHGPNLHPYARKKCVGSIMILRAKNILYPVQTIQFLLTLFNIEDKQLRKILYKYILNDIRRMNKHHKNMKINQELRNFIYENIIKNSDKMTQKSLQMMIDLYKRNIWTDNRSVNVIAEGCFNQSAKIRMIAAHFLISTTEPLEEMEDSDDEDAVDPKDIKLVKGIKKHSKNKQKKIEKEKKRALKRLRKKEIEGRRENFMPIDVIYSPQEFAQKLFNFMLKKNIKFSHKLIYMALISRMIWRHSLIILPWYGALVKYLEPKQKQVHKILTYFAQSVHENLPDDEVETVIKHIIEKFVNDRCSEFAMTIGLNTIREVYTKMNSIINEETMLYLASYYEYRNKNVRAAAKALINLVRDINPYLLEKKYRGRNFNEPSEMVKGKDRIKTTIDGAELLDHKGDVPIYMDRVLTDEDFKQIKKLKRKQQEEKEWENIKNMEEQGQGQEEGQEEEIDDENLQDGEEEGEQQEDDDEEQDEVSESDQNQEIDWQDCQQIEQMVEGDEDEEQQEEDEQEEVEEEEEEVEEDQEQDEEQDEELIDQQEGEEDQSQQMQDQSEEASKKKEKKTQKKRLNHQKQEHDNKKNGKKNNDLDSDSSDQVQDDSDPNPHGFLSVDQIAFYKKSKTEIKSDRKRNNQSKEKFKKTRKEKKGGSTNKEKLKNKPLMMLRDKKNRIRSQQKQVKLRIKNLKNQLGRVKSGKEAKFLKNKKITKKAKRR